MKSSTSHERVRYEPIREEYSHVQSSSELIQDAHSFNDERPLSHHDRPAPSLISGSGLNGEEAHTNSEMAMIRPTSAATLQITFSDANSTSILCNEGPEVGQPTFTPYYSNGSTLASNSEGSTEPDGRQLPSRTVTQRDFSWCLAWFFDIVLTIIPLVFLALAVLALRVDHQLRSDLGEKVLAATRLGPTIFPIAFAAVCGRFFQNLSRWRLERPNGVKLGTLEQLSGSQSFPGAVQRAFTVRSGHWTSAIIIMIWALSPIGGQSSLRLFSHGYTTFETELDVFYANPEYQFSTWESASAMSHESNAVFTLYSGLLLSSPSQRADLSDLWNRPKIPQLPRAMINNYTMGWHDISEADLQSAEGYSSLLGLDVRGVTTDVPGRQFRFSINSSYVDTECERVTTYRYKNMTQMQYGQSSFVATLQNYTESGEPMSWFLNTELSGHRLYYDSRDMKHPQEPTRFECVLRRIPVQVEFHCVPHLTAGCGARRLRRREERFDKGPSGWDDPEAGLFQILPWSMPPSAMANMLAYWPTAAGTPDLWEGASATDNFLAGDEYLFVSQVIRTWDRDASNMTLFSRRMTTIFNTIFQVSLYPENVTTTNSSFIGRLRASPSSDHRPLGSLYDATRAIALETRDIYVADRRWCATLLLVGSILQILAVVGFWLRACISGPDLLGFASSLMRDNPFFPKSVNSYGSALSGADRARICRDMRVQIADVRPEEENGYIVFKSVSPQGEEDLAWGQRTLNGKRLFM